MNANHSSINKTRIVRLLFVLGIVFYLVKVQNTSCTSSDCSGDRIATTVELVLSTTPDYGFDCPPPGVSTFQAGTDFFPMRGIDYSRYIFLAEQHDRYARAVLKAGAAVYAGQIRRDINCQLRMLPRRSSDSGPQSIG
jgi:hypothetical protein